MNYEDISDFVINTQITAIVNELENWEFCKNAKVFYRNDGPEYDEQAVIDYCNSWGDMGPLIEESRIAIEPCGNMIEGNYWIAEYPPCQVKHKSPLRAAAICWLMIKEGNS